MTEDQTRLIVDRLDDLHRCLDEHIRESTQWRQATAARLDVMQAELTKNTEITDQVRATAVTARIVRKGMGWLSAMVVSVASIWWAVKNWGAQP